MTNQYKICQELTSVQKFIPDLNRSDCVCISENAILIKVAKLEIIQCEICLNNQGTDLENRTCENQLSENLDVFKILHQINVFDHRAANPQQLYQWINLI